MSVIGGVYGDEKIGQVFIQVIIVVVTTKLKN